MKNSFVQPVFAALVAILMLNGCAGYRLGSMLPPEIKTVFVPTFVNKADEPFLEVDTTRAVIEELQRDGSLRIAPQDKAHAILYVTLTDYRLRPLAYTSDRATTPDEYRVVITATIELVRTDTGEVIMRDDRVRGDDTFEVIGDLSTSKQLALPGASRDLASEMVQRIVEYW